MNRKINVACIIFECIAILCLLSMPFVAVNILTMGNQPTALDILKEDVFILGDLKETSIYWSSLSSIVCLGVCFIATLIKRDGLTKTFAIIGLLPMFITFIDILSFIEGNFEYLFDMAGLGYWGTLIGFFILIAISKPIYDKTSQPVNAQSQFENTINMANEFSQNYGNNANNNQYPNNYNNQSPNNYNNQYPNNNYNNQYPGGYNNR